MRDHNKVPITSDAHASRGLENRVTEQVIGAAIEVRRAIGPGLLESVYQRCLQKELCDRGVEINSQVRVPIIYKGVRIDSDYVLDLLVEDCVVVELKAVESMAAVHATQVLTYLRLTNLRVGLLINFNVPTLKSGIRRIVNQFDPG